MERSRQLAEDVRATFDEAGAAAGTAEQSFRIANRVVLVTTIGEPLTEIVTRALAPLRVSGVAPPDFVVRCWDTTTSGIALAAPPWSPDDYQPGGRIRGFGDPRIPVVFDLPTGTLNIFDRDRAEGFCWTSDAKRLPSWFRRSPFRVVFGWWAEARGLALVHAGAVGDDDGVVLVTGAGGAGKSTTVFSARRAGLRILSDDLTLVELPAGASGPPLAHAAYGTAKVEADTITRLPELGDQADPVGDGSMVDLGEELLPSAPLLAVLAVEVHDAPTEIVPMSPARCLLTLAPSSILGATAAEPTTLGIMATVVDRVPCFRIRVGPDPDDVATAIVRLLERG